MKIRHTEVIGINGDVSIEVRDITLEQHIKEKLVHVGTSISGYKKDLGIGKFDIENYQLREYVPIKQSKIDAIELFLVARNKHESIKSDIKRCSTHEELDAISWSNYV